MWAIAKPCKTLFWEGGMQEAKYQNVQGVGSHRIVGVGTQQTQREVVTKGNINKNRGHIDKCGSRENMCAFMSSL